jgi:hypothetical protein
LQFEVLLEKYSFAELLSLWNDHMKSKGLDVFMIMFVHQEGPTLQRDLLLLSDNDILRMQLEVELSKLKVERLAFQSMSAVYVKDTNAIYTRKIIEPLVAKVMNE